MDDTDVDFFDSRPEEERDSQNGRSDDEGEHVGYGHGSEGGSDEDEEEEEEDEEEARKVSHPIPCGSSCLTLRNRLRKASLSRMTMSRIQTDPRRSRFAVGNEESMSNVGCPIGTPSRFLWPLRCILTQPSLLSLTLADEELDEEDLDLVEENTGVKLQREVS